jgi:hypothetical protein
MNNLKKVIGLEIKVWESEDHTAKKLWFPVYETNVDQVVNQVVLLYELKNEFKGANVLRFWEPDSRLWRRTFVDDQGLIYTIGHDSWSKDIDYVVISNFF